MTNRTQKTKKWRIAIRGEFRRATQKYLAAYWARKQKEA